MSQKNVSHTSGSVLQVAAPSGVTSSVTVSVTKATTSTSRVWVSTNPLVSIYPWYGTSVTLGNSVSVTALPGQAVYTHSVEPAQLSVTIV